METENFIDEQLKMLKNDFEYSHIQANVYRYIFKRGILNFNINALIMQCMALYGEIIKRHHGTIRSKNN